MLTKYYQADGRQRAYPRIVGAKSGRRRGRSRSARRQTDLLLWPALAASSRPGAKRAKSPCRPWRHARSGLAPRQARILRWNWRSGAAWPWLPLRM